MKKRLEIELLAPAGSYDSFLAAIHSGADAVYIGGAKFGARAYADNFELEELKKAIDYAHLHGRKVYLTMNTLLKEHEMEKEAVSYLEPLYRHGLDAVIVQDTGVFQMVKETFPDIEIHVSTQMTITGPAGVSFWQEKGASRIVLARELSLDEIRAIYQETKASLECFVHGALCYSYSGQCLFSSMIGGRSGNRGRCAQTCRLPFRTGKEEQYLLSPKDICTLELLPELIEAGIFSFKIEGRMKRPEYTAGVTSIYRKYIDRYRCRGKTGYKVEEADLNLLLDLFNRGGFSQGYYQKRNGKEMMSTAYTGHYGIPVGVVRTGKKGLSIETKVPLHGGDLLQIRGRQSYEFTVGKEKENQNSFLVPVKKGMRFKDGTPVFRMQNKTLQSNLRAQWLDVKYQEKIKGKLILSAGESAKLELKAAGSQITVTSAVPEPALQQPLTEERIRKQMNKTGNTPFVFEELEIVMEEALFIPMNALNEIRRNGLAQLEASIVEQARRTKIEKPTDFEKESNSPGRHDLTISIMVNTKAQLEKLLDIEEICRIYLDMDSWLCEYTWEEVYEAADMVRKCGKQCFAALPRILRKNIHILGTEVIRLEKHVDGVLIRDYESYGTLIRNEFIKPIHLDYNIYIYNQMAKKFWQETKVHAFTAPVELNRRELTLLGTADMEIITYGYLPVMVSAQCVQKNLTACDKRNAQLTITDRKNKTFAVRCFCSECFNMIYNSSPLDLSNQWEAIEGLQPLGIRLQFTQEDPELCRKIVKQQIGIFRYGEKEKEMQGDYTRGHFLRGIE